MSDSFCWVMMACDCLWVYINATWCLTIPPSTPNQPPTSALVFASGLGGFGRLLWASILLEPTSDETPSASGHRAGCRDPESRSPWSPWRAWRGGGWAHCDATYGAAGVTARVAAADGTLGATDGATHVAWPNCLAGRIIDMLRATHSHHSGAWCRPIRWCQMEVPGRACWHVQR